MTLTHAAMRLPILGILLVFLLCHAGQRALAQGDSFVLQGFSRT